MQLRSSIKAFVAKPLGRIALLSFISLALAGSSIYLGYLIAIPVFLLTGIGLPIYLGWSRPRTLFLVGLAALLIAGPIVTVGTVSLLLTPSPAVNGEIFAPHTQSVLQNASVHPYYRSASGNFTFSANVNPAFLTAGSGPKVVLVVLSVTTCPDALIDIQNVLVRNNASSCGAPGTYPFHSANFTYNASTAIAVSFVQKLGGVNVWWWTMGAEYLNASGKVAWLYLTPTNGYTLAEGPVTGDYLSIYLLILPAIYFTVF
ncbi:MAG: hypothetical protein L3J97_06705, partial [Thermoplasmata archaeon]|nr:hypothetical protein [Thermoplasmata archaeon]